MLSRYIPLMGTFFFTFAMLSSLPGKAADDGSQLNNPFRVNYAGYLPQASKTALYITDNKGPIRWQVVGNGDEAPFNSFGIVGKHLNINCQGSEDTYIKSDFASGDSFYIIDFSSCTSTGQRLTLQVDQDKSAPFDISSDPYGGLKYDFFDYFRDHEFRATFNQTKNNWQHDLSITFSYVMDAGDNGVYPVNTAEASWALINMLETYPQINAYYSENIKGGYTVYEQLKVLTEQFYHLFDHGEKLAIPKFHTNVNKTYAACAPHFDGTCISEPETKATLSAARTLAAMARIHAKLGYLDEAANAYRLGLTAYNNAKSEPHTCRQIDSFGGEGGMYPDNDNYSGYRSPEKPRDNCFPDPDNTQDDEYAALVEIFLAAKVLSVEGDAEEFKALLTNHRRFDDVSSYWWGAVAMEGSLSLLANEAIHDINLDNLKTKIIAKADEIQKYQSVGYPGVTWDAQSNRWDSGDLDDIDNNFRWGSNRMALNDGRILMAASEIQRARKANESAASYARSAIQVLDFISGINGVNLAMYTAPGYPNIENAVSRTHDGVDPKNLLPGKLALGPNNWTNANDGSMPAFGSQPGLKMFALTGTGWSSREISIDANASIIPVAFFTTEVAPQILALSPISQYPVKFILIAMGLLLISAIIVVAIFRARSHR